MTISRKKMPKIPSKTLEECTQQRMRFIKDHKNSLSTTNVKNF